MEWGNGDTHLFMKGLNLIYLVQCCVNVTDKCDIETDCEIVGERERQKEREELQVTASQEIPIVQFYVAVFCVTT